MASAGRRGPFRRREPQPARGIRVHSPRRHGPWASAAIHNFSAAQRSAIVASAARLDAGDRTEAKVQRMLRQGWQSDAWNYRDAIGELRYAVNFLANCTARMRLYPAVYPLGGEADEPVAMTEADGVPEQLLSAAGQAIADLGNGRTAISGMLHSLSTNKSVAGESYLLGRTDPGTREQLWTIRSVDEMVVYDEKWHLREIPDDRQNAVIPWIELDPVLSVISRMWTPHPRFQLLADSPLRAMLDDCESLLILRRMIRATGRSRLASRGLLLLPQELSIKNPVEDDDDPEAYTLTNQLAAAMMAPIVNEGTADGVVPILLEGPAEALRELRLIEMAQSFDEQASRTREELIGIMATTFDLPKEVIEGIVDLNHWSAWQVDDNTFRHHVEPHVISCCDDLSGAYFRPYLAAAGIPNDWAQRALLWYDPTELVTHPDQTADAKDLYDRHAISGEALARTAGFGPDDMPSPEEIILRMLANMRTPPPNLVMAAVHQMFPTLTIPPIETSGTVPGVKPSGVDVGEEPPQLGPGQAGPPVAVDSAPIVTPPAADDSQPGPPPADRPLPHPPPVTAAGNASVSARRLSRRLQAIDADLRARLQTAANAALMRQLERAGARLRSKVAKDETLRTRIAHRANERVPALLGPAVAAAAGLSPTELIAGDWGTLRTQYQEWTQAAQEQALNVALRIVRQDRESPAAARAQQTLEQGRDAGWELLQASLTNLAHHLLYNPDPNAGPGDWADLNPDTLVPARTVRAALALAGGAATTLEPAATGEVALADPVGQIGTGSAIEDLITSAGGQRAGYEWVHGPSLKPFEPHLDLDGVEFETFDDDQLANGEGWPENEYFMPGDHDGCLCDFMPIYLSPEE